MLPEIGNEEIRDHYQIYKKIDPILLGINISLVKQLMDHPDLQRQQQRAQENAQKAMITLHHSLRKLSTL